MTVGKVEVASYRALVKALHSGRPEDFDAVRLGGTRKLTNPCSALAYALEGPYPAGLTLPPAPRIDSAVAAAAMGELYWRVLLRDVAFSSYEDRDLVEKAIDDLNGFSAPPARSTPTAASRRERSLFRGFTPGDVVGPSISQLLLRDTQIGTLAIGQRQETARPGTHYMTSEEDWSVSQRGAPVNARPNDLIDAERGYIRNARDLSHYVHFDHLYQPYLVACMILLDLATPFDPGNPYPRGRRPASGRSAHPTCRRCSPRWRPTRCEPCALRAMGFHKWLVHRRLRPEALGGRIHFHLTEKAEYPSHADILSSSVAQRVCEETGTHLLAQAFSEGSPTSLLRRGARRRGRCVRHAAQGLARRVPSRPPTGDRQRRRDRAPALRRADRGRGAQQAGRQLSIGRNMGGVHYRSDYAHSLRLGEAVALGVLDDSARTYSESHAFTATTFDGHSVTVPTP